MTVISLPTSNKLAKIIYPVLLQNESRPEGGGGGEGGGGSVGFEKSKGIRSFTASSEEIKQL